MKPVLWMLLLVGFSGMLLFYVWGRVDVVRVGYELDAFSKKKAVLEQEHDRLRIRLSQLTAPDRIAAEANKQLKMTRLSPRQVILVPIRTDNGVPRNEVTFPLRFAQHTRD